MRPVDPASDSLLPLPPVRQIAGELKLEAYATSHSGRRLVNEDSFFSQVDPDMPSWLLGLFIVADGIGGQQNGQVASNTAVRAVRDHFLSTDRFFTPDTPFEMLATAFMSANDITFQLSQTDSALNEMGTTLTVGVVAQRRLYVASLGDSRVYLHRGRRLVRLTQDDWYRTQAGDDDEDSPTGLQKVTVVNRAIGWPEDPEPQLVDIEIGVDDLLLFCTDGITDGLVDRQIEAVLHKHRKRLDIAVHRLMESCVHLPDADNSTVILARVSAR